MSEQKLNSGAGVPDEVLAGGEDVEALKARIRALEQETKAQRAAAVSEEKVGGIATASSAATKERYAIIVEEGAEATAIKRVPVQVNGRAYLIERGKRVEVPPEVVHVLENAVIDKSISVEDERTGLPNGIVLRPTRRFPFQNLGKVVDADGNRLDGKLAA